MVTYTGSADRAKKGMNIREKILKIFMMIIIEPHNLDSSLDYVFD